ncbi:GNAT family N-acetyltransferase [Comamonas avium]|uniref:N-acetyltransferase n=1 Tax=Comamonas avium TaxID=2762231 RepID=A0ABR8S729_9BURK|nr:N-acetyltransferase [Comamonas avium]MBD7959291.1 N-acetyltransferase [Comamonas avium]
MHLHIRNEQPQDIATITALTVAAFASAAHSSHTEHCIVNALRRSQQLSVSLVAVLNEDIVGHVAASPVTISSGAQGWFGIGPISVSPKHQGQGIGSALMQAALTELQQLCAMGCVVLGEPGYYSRFGFAVHPGLELPGVPPEYFQALSFGPALPQGTVQYHAAFEATA